MHGIPISRVAPRGTPSSCEESSADWSVMVSVEVLRLRVPLTVRVLFVDTTLACFKCVLAGVDLAFAFTVPEPLNSVGLEGADTPFSFGGTGGGRLDFLEAALLVAVDAVETVDDTDERAEEVESDLFAEGAGDSFFLSTEGEGGSRLLLVDMVETFDAVEDTLTLGEVVDVAVVLTLVVEVVDTTRDRVTELRAAELGVMSDFAVSKFVDPSLTVDIVEFGRDRPEGGRRVEGPATVLRIVEACDLTDAADDRTRAEAASLADAVDVRGLRTAAGVCRDTVLVEATESRVEERTEVVTVCAGVSFESGRTPETLTLREVVAVVAREAVE
jgi:hypothetical protein